MDYDKEEFARIKKAAGKIQGDSEVLVVIGIGGDASASLLTRKNSVPFTCTDAYVPSKA